MTHSIQFETITPHEARRYLEHNHRNRTIAETRVMQLADDIRNGRYLVTHQGIAFDTNGDLVDGQHRLTAIIAADTAATMPVARGLSPLTMTLVDRGRPRRPSDFLAGKHRTLRVAGARVLIGVSLLKGEVSGHSLAAVVRDIPPGLFDQFLPEALTLVDDFALDANSAARRTEFGGGGMLAAAATYPEFGHDFLMGVYTGTGLVDGDVRAAVRNYTMPQKRMGSGATSAQALLLMRAVQNFASEKRVAKLQSLRGDFTYQVPSLVTGAHAYALENTPEVA